MRKPHIAFFCDEFPPRAHGGIGVFVQSAVELLSKNGYRVTVVEFARQAEIVVRESYTIVRLKRSRLPKVGWVVERLKIWSWVAFKSLEGSLDIFEVPDYQGWFPFPFGVPHVKIVARLHMSSTVLARSAGKTINARHCICEFLTLWSADHWVAVSSAILTATRNTFCINHVPAELIYNSVDIANHPATVSFQSDSFEKPYICFVGSVTDEKGARILAQACRVVFRRFPDVGLVYVGGYSDTDTTCTPALILGDIGDEYANHVKFLGRQPRSVAIDLIKRSQIVALPSSGEAFGLACVEAMALEKPVVFTNRGSGPEIISHGVHGLLIDPVNPNAVAAALIFLLENPGLSSAMARRARDTAEERFSARAWVKKSELFFKRLTGNFAPI